MTVAVQDPINQFVISSVAQTTGPWTWQLNQASDLTVFKLSFDTGLITTLVLGTDYSVNSAGLGNKLGGTITFLSPAQIPPVVGDIWTLQRNTELIRKKDFATSGDFQAVTVNPQFDDPILIAQDTQRDAENALRKDPAIGDKLNPLIPQMVDRRTIIFEETTPGNFDMVMSDSDPDDQSNAAAQSAAEAAVSATDAAASESLAAASAAAAAEESDDAAASAAEAAQSAASALGLYSAIRIAGPYIGDNFITNEQAPEPEAATFSADGLTMFIVDSGSNNIFQYSLTNAFNMHEGNVTFTGLFFSIEGESLENPQDVKFNTDGTKMFVLAGTPSNEIREYDLTNGFDFSIPPTDSTNLFSVAGQETEPTGLVFSPDGFIMFIVGKANIPRKAQRYNLTVAFSLAVSNVAFDTDFDLPPEVDVPQSIAFNPDGTEMFVLNENNPSTVFDYVLENGFSFTPDPIPTGNQFDTGVIDDAPAGIIFSADGTKLFIVAQEFQAVYEYLMPKAFDLPHGVTFSGLDFSVVEATTPKGVTFNNDGTRMYITEDSTASIDIIFQFDLTIPYSLAFDNVKFFGDFVGISETTNIRNMVFNADGSRMFVLGATTKTGYEYTVSPNFDIGGTVTFTGNTFVFSGEDNLPSSMVFSADGFKLYMTGAQLTKVFEYDLTVAFSFAAANVIFNGSFFDPSAQIVANQIEAIQFNADGSLMFLLGKSATDGRDSLFQYELLSSFNLTAGITGAVSFSKAFFGVNAQDQLMTDFVFNSDGTKFFSLGNSNNSVYEYDLGFPFRINQFIYPVEDDENGLLLQVGTTLGDVEVILPDSANLSTNFRVGIVKVSDDANKVIVRHQGIDAINIEEESIDLETLDKVVGFFLDIAEPNWIADIGEAVTGLYNESKLISSANQDPSDSGFSFSDSSSDNLPKGTVFSDDGDDLFIVGAQNQKVYRYSLNVPFSLEFGATGPVQELFVGDRLTNPEGIIFSTSGHKLFVVGTGAAGPVTGPSVIQYQLQNPFDFFSAIFETFFNVSTQDALPKAVRISRNGRVMYVLGTTNNKIYQYNLSSPNDVSSAAFNAVEESVNGQDTAPIGFDLSADGLSLFMVGDTNDTVFQYSLVSAFNLAGLSFTGKTFTLPFSLPDPRSIFFQQTTNQDTGELPGSKFFIVDATLVGIEEFLCPTPYELGTALVVTPKQNGFLFRVDTTGGNIGIVLPPASSLFSDFRFGIIKTSADGNLVNVLPDGTDSINDTTSVSFSIQSKVVLISLDRESASWVADLGEPPAVTAFRGCLVNLTALVVIATAMNVVLPWGAEAYDTDDIHDIGVNPSRLTVPAGVTRVRLSARFRWDNNATGIRRITITKNGSFNWAVGIAQEELPASGGINISSAMTAVAIVTGGDFFEVFAQQTSGGNLNIQSSVAWFQMEILE